MPSLTSRMEQIARRNIWEDKNHGTLRVLVADDHEIVRTRPADILEEQARLGSSGEACDGREASGKARDFEARHYRRGREYAGLNGLEATRPDATAERRDQGLINHA